VVRLAGAVELNPRVAAKLGVRDDRTKDPALDQPLAGWWRRFGSGIVDMILAWVLTIGLLFVAAPGFLTNLGRQFLAYAADVQTAALSATIIMPNQALINDVSTLSLVAGGVMLAYTVIFLGAWGATLGQKLTGIRVIKAPVPVALLPAVAAREFTAEKPGWLRAVSKGLSWTLFATGGGIFVLVQLLNALLPLWHRRKQSVTDLFASTLVIRADGHPGEPPSGD
jgi:uncharacterized RDD family membrane protein YckC